MNYLKGILGTYVQRSKDFADKFTDKVLSYMRSPVYSVDECGTYKVKAPFLAEDIVYNLRGHCDTSMENSRSNKLKTNRNVALQDLYESIKGTNISADEIKAMEAPICLFADMDYYRDERTHFENNFAALASELIENGYNGSEVLEEPENFKSGVTIQNTKNKSNSVSFLKAIESITGVYPEELAGKKIVTAGGGNVNQEENPLSHVFDPFHWVYNWVSRNKKTVGNVMAGLAILGAVEMGANYVYKNNKDFANYVDSNVAKAKSVLGIDTPSIVASEIAIQTLAEAASASAFTYAPANGSAEEYHFSPGIDIHGSPQYTKKVQDELVKLEKIDPVEFAEVMKYLEVVRERGDSTVGKGVRTITEDVLDSAGFYALIHEKEHEKQNLEPTFSLYYKGKGGWPKEFDAVKKEVKVYAKHHNLTEEEELQMFKFRLTSYKKNYPKEYAQFISEN